MSDATIVNIVTAVVTGSITITTMIIGFLTLWVKLKYGIDQAGNAAAKAEVAAGDAATAARGLEEKVDHNTTITTQAATKAGEAAEHAATCDEERVNIMQIMKNHDGRISALETQMAALK